MLVFKNKGLIPEATITVMGVHVKTIDNPIGQFGTGLKYAISIILRLGGKITIYRGTKKLEFALTEQQIRGKDFRIVNMNGKKLGFTDHMGINWKPWMAYRELTSNARDEGGTVHLWPFDADKAPEGEKGYTTIVVDCPELDTAHHDRHTLFLQTEPLWSLVGVDVHPGESEYIFYRGIRVMKLDKKSKYTYNLTKAVQLTEDRTILYPTTVPMYIVEAVMQSPSAMFLENVLNSEKVKEKFENSLPYGAYGKNIVPSEQFMDVYETLKSNKLAVGNAGSAWGYHADRSESRPSPYDYSPSTTEELLIERNLERLVEKGLVLKRHDIYFKSNLENGKVQIGTRGRVILADRLLRDNDKLARALVEAKLLLVGGGMIEQLSNFVLNGEFIPEELCEGFTRRSNAVEEMVF